MLTCLVSQSYVKGQFVTVGVSLVCVYCFSVLLNDILRDGVCCCFQFYSSFPIKFSSDLCVCVCVCVRVCVRACVRE